MSSWKETLPRHTGKARTPEQLGAARLGGPGLSAAEPPHHLDSVLFNVFFLPHLFLSPLPLAPRSLNEVLAVSVPDEKKTKRLLIRRLRVAALSHRITLISQAWKAKNKTKKPKQ